MNRRHAALAGLALAALAAPAHAQNLGYDGQLFVEAVKKGDNEKALELIQKRSTVVNAKDNKGDTALLAAIARRDDVWTGYLLKEGADPDLAGNGGETPLIAAARIGYMQAIEWLLGLGAKVNADNRMGETPIIVAVQGRHIAAVRLLLQEGADPDKADSAQGFSARDYARRDTRSSELLRLIEMRKPKSAAAGPSR